MTRYVADAVALNRRLAGREPAAVERIFDRAEDGVDRVLATPIQLAEVVDTFDRDDEIAGETPTISGREAVRTLTSGPVEICELGRDGVLRLDRLFELYSMHDAVLVAAHHAHETAGILTNDHEIKQYDGDAVVWS